MNASKKKPRILFFLNAFVFFKSHFKDLANELNLSGYEVYVATPEFQGEIDGIKYISFPLRRKSLNILNEIRSIIEMYNLIKTIKPDLVHLFTVKPVAYVGLLKLFYFRNLPSISTITGLGSIYSNSSLKATVLKPFINALYSHIFKLKKTMVVFENKDDRDLFLNKNYAEESKAKLIYGAGVDTKIFRFVNRDFNRKILKVIFVGRLLKDKGIIELLESASLCKDLNLKFLIAGTYDEGNISSLTPEQISKFRKFKNIDFLGYRSDIAELYQQCHIACLPSYREGLPKSLAEASSSGLPIITTDTEGCREIVPSDEYGFLVKTKSVDSLVTCLNYIDRNRDNLLKISRKTRLRAEKYYAKEIIWSLYKELYQEILK